MPDEVLLVVLVVMAIGVGWKWAKNRIDEKKWRETSLTRKFFISLIALLLIVLFWIGAMFIRYLGHKAFDEKLAKRFLFCELTLAQEHNS